nr:xin actin-binding repeat-containing protein 1 isoform X1 [Nothobranchius furzeri]
MEVFSLRRTQSLRSLSGARESSWVTSAHASWSRKSVSQLVQHYQSCGDLGTSEQNEPKLQVSDSRVDGCWRMQEGRETLWKSAWSSNLSRSRSMDVLPQRETSSTRALCALFESKSTLQQDYNSGPRLDSQSKTGRGCPLQDWRSYNTPLKETSHQRTTQVDGQKVTNGLLESHSRASRHPTDDKYNNPLSKGGTESRQPRDRTSSSSSVRDRLALYLTKAAASDLTGGFVQPEFVATPGSKVKHNKMAEAARKFTVSQACPEEDDLLPPPPPPVPPKPADYEGPAALCSLPVPPPKESFTTLYQQRQKNELKRLFKHIHPDVRASLDDAVDDEIMKAVQSESAQAADGSYQGEVQSMRWIFENWTLDNIGDPHETKKLLHTEELKGGDVRSTSSKFEYVDSARHTSTRRQSSVRGDVRTSTWLFETQPLGSLSRSKGEEGELVEAVLKEPLQSGDVRGTRLLFETKPLSDLGRCNSIEDCSVLKLKSELQEQRGDFQKTLKLFQTDPGCAIRDKNGNIHTVTSICREEISSSNFSTARWLFETQPLDTVNKGSDGMKMIRGISLEEGHRGGVDQKRWMFETQPFDTIQEVAGVGEFDGRAERCLEKEAIIGGDVKTSLWLFETQPVETLSGSYEVGRLQKITLSAEEQGEVKGKKLIFENGNFQKYTSRQEEEIKKGDVKSYKQLFETIPLSKISHFEKEITTKEEQSGENVKDDKNPLYAIRDGRGNIHEVVTVSREEIIKGKVKNYKWMFGTKPLDQLVDAKGNVEVIKGITRKEDTTGDVKMAKWFLETQTTDGIHLKCNQNEQSSSVKEEPCKDEVKTCKWLFETETESIDADSKATTWLFESQPQDGIKDGEPISLKLCSSTMDPVKCEVKTTKHLFETETFKISEQNLKYISQVHLQSGGVSRVKELFESQSLDEIGSEKVTSSEGQNQDEHIERGSVHKFTWMFENCPMTQISKDHDGVSMEIAGVIEKGDVQNKKFIFETSSLDKIHQESNEEKSVPEEGPLSNVDVKSSSMMFESMPLYAIRDKEGQFHEVTTVRKEEVMSGDVKGARWMFETKPLDAIKAENDVYVIRAVTQEDVKTGGVKSARWKFETQPLDSFGRDEPPVRVTGEIEGINVQQNKTMFESDQSSRKFVRMVSVTDVKRGDVRTSTWLFENQTLDSLKGEPEEQSPVQTVHREDSQKGDVKRCTWLFESQPLDKFRELEEASDQAVEEIPKADVKCTTWLFETTPLDKITASSTADTLSYLYEMNFIHSSGIIIEANEQNNVNMAKFQLESNGGVKIQKEDVVTGQIRNIMLQLLLKPTIKPQVSLLREVEKGKINTAVIELPVFESTTAAGIERDQRIQNITQTIEELLIYKKHFKKGIVMQEAGDGKAEMSVYSLISNAEIKTESQIVERGDVKSTIGNLLATANSHQTATSCRVDENEKGNVNLFKSCIEKGDLQYLKSLHAEASECEADHSSLIKEQIETIQGGVKEAKRSLWQQKEQVERSICDVLPGDVQNTKKVFASESCVGADSSVPKEEIIPGDISSAKQQLAAKPPVTVDKEEIVPGDIRATMESLERAKQQSMSVERETFQPGTIYDMDISSQGPVEEGSQPQKEVIVSGNVRAAKKSLEMAKQQSLHVERDVVVPGKIYNLGVSAQEESSSKVMQTTYSSSSRIQQIKTNPKVSEAEQESQVSFDSCQQRAVLVSNCARHPLPHLIDCDFNGQSTEGELGDDVRGDVKAAIRSLQSASTEQKFVDKENIIRGNVQMALESLGKSKVNVSKGDYQAAMIYRNSGRACSGRSKTVHNQCVVVSVPPTDTKLSHSIAVTCEGQPSISTQISVLDIVANGNSTSPSSERVTPPPLVEQTRKPKEQKPALPPKPQWIKTIALEGPNTSPAPAPEVTFSEEDDISRVVPPKQRQQHAVQAADKRQDVTAHGKNSKGSSHELLHQQNGDETKCGSNGSNEVLMTDSNFQQNERKSNVNVSSSKEEVIERNVIQKINAVEEIQMCMKNYTEDGKQEMSKSLQNVLQNFERKDGEDRRDLLAKKVKVIHNNASEDKYTDKTTVGQRKHHPNPAKNQHRTPAGASQSNDDQIPLQQNDLKRNNQEVGSKVVMREKKVRETEEERRQRLSVHKDEIMKGNVKAAMEIFENLKKREELKGILSQVQEMEGEDCGVDANSLMTLYDNVPAWMATTSRNATKCKMEGKKVEVAWHDDDLESISSVETAFEDLEKASKEIMKLKEQTLAKLVDIEETIKKALYSVSNLKSEADIAGLSGLFDESLKSEQNFLPPKNIRKISIVSSKSKPGPANQTKGSDSNLPKGQVSNQPNKKPLIRQSSSQSSPSFISIHSTRKPSEQQKPTMTTFKPNSEVSSHSCTNATHDLDPVAPESSKNGLSPERKVSVLEVKAVPKQEAGIVGTRTVSETYEESDGFGNVFVSSTTSTFITNQPDGKTPALFEVIGSPTRYEVLTSPSAPASGSPSGDRVLNNPKKEGRVFVSFRHPKEKH